MHGAPCREVLDEHDDGAEEVHVRVVHRELEEHGARAHVQPMVGSQLLTNQRRGVCVCVWVCVCGVVGWVVWWVGTRFQPVTGRQLLAIKTEVLHDSVIRAVLRG